MIGMIMSDDYVMYTTNRQTIVFVIFFQCAYPHTSIDQKSIFFGKEEIAITTTPTAERYKFQHFLVLILHKSNQID
jgi:hypothetical protein